MDWNEWEDMKRYGKERTRKSRDAMPCVITRCDRITKQKKHHHAESKVRTQSLLFPGYIR